MQLPQRPAYFRGQGHLQAHPPRLQRLLSRIEGAVALAAPATATAAAATVPGGSRRAASGQGVGALDRDSLPVSRPSRPFEEQAVHRGPRLKRQDRRPEAGRRVGCVLCIVGQALGVPPSAALASPDEWEAARFERLGKAVGA